MMNLKREYVNDDSYIAVNYEKYMCGTWVHHSIKFKSEKDAFIKRCVDNGKRKIIDFKKQHR